MIPRQVPNRLPTRINLMIIGVLWYSWSISRFRQGKVEDKKNFECYNHLTPSPPESHCPSQTDTMVPPAIWNRHHLTEGGILASFSSVWPGIAFIRIFCDMFYHTSSRPTGSTRKLALLQRLHGQWLSARVDYVAWLLEVVVAWTVEKRLLNADDYGIGFRYRGWI